MFIKSIRAQRILGEFDYNLEFPANGVDSSRMGLIYAENGRGKTNLLKATNALLKLSSDAYEVLWATPLKCLEVEFEGEKTTDGDIEDDSDTSVPSGAHSFRGTIRLDREDVLDQGFNLQLKIDREANSSEILVAQVGVGDLEKTGMKLFSTRNKNLTALSDRLREVGPKSLYIGDDRLTPTKSMDHESRSHFEYLIGDVKPKVGPMEALVRDVESALRQAALTSFSRESKSADVYSSIAASILDGVAQNSTGAQAREKLAGTVEKLIAKARPLDEYDLMSTKQLDDISVQINEARSNNRNFPSLLAVLTPYLDSLEKQIEYLEPAYRIIDTYIVAVNSFLDRKRLNYSARRGLRMLDRNSRPLAPDSLSSGERHLLFLLSHAVLAVDKYDLLLIDEPELSLGIDWQRKLLDALLRCSASGQVQFVLASHSLQVLTSKSGHIDVVRPVEAAS